MSEAVDDVERRRLEALAMQTGTLVPARLGALLGDEDWRVRKQAAETASASLLTPGVIDVLVVGLLQPDDVGLRNAAVEAFARAPVGEANVVAEALGRALAEAPRTARKFVASALVGAGEGALAPLATLVRDDDVMTASCAIEALAAVARRGVDGAAVEALLLETLGRSEPVIRLAALDGLLATEAVVDASRIAPLLEDRITRPSALQLLPRARSVRPSPDARATGPQASESERVDEVVTLLLGTLADPRSTVETALALARRGEADGALGAIGPALSRAFAELDAYAIDELSRAIDFRPPTDARAIARVALEGRELRLLPSIVELGARAELDPPCREALLALGHVAVAPLASIARARAADDVRVASWALEAASDLAALSPREELGEAIESLRQLARAMLDQGEQVAAHAAASTLARWGEAADAHAIAERVDAHGTAYEAAAVSAVEQIASRAPSAARESLPARVGRRSLSSPSLRAAPDLRALLGSEDPALRAHSLDDVVAITSIDELELVALCLTDGDEQVELAALRALTRARGASVVASAIAAARIATRSELAPVRAEAIQCLAQLGAFGRTSMSDVLTAALSDTSPGVVIAALRVLGVAAGSEALAASVDAALAHPDAEVVKEALLAVPVTRVVEPAVAALGHEHWSVRARAAEVLGRVASLSADPALRTRVRAALEDRRAHESDDLVARTLVTVLEETG